MILKFSIINVIQRLKHLLLYNMAKRRISQQQEKRILAKQSRHVQQAQAQQQDEKAACLFDPDVTNADLQPGVVIANLGKTALIEKNDGQILLCHSRQHLETLVPGDHVVWQVGENPDHPRDEIHAGHVVVAVHPRRTTLMRYSAQGDIKPMAANLDQLIIVFASQPLSHWDVIDSYLVLAQHLQLQPLLLCNKMDLGPLDIVTQTHCATLSALGYPILYVSAKSGNALSALEEKLMHHVSIFVGQSGVGKSSLAKYFLPDHTIPIAKDENDVSVARLGKHTTTTARLYHLPRGGDLIDSPGVRIVHTRGMSPAEITKGFKEIAAAAQHCQFRNCQHRQEPDCAVQAALTRGDISLRRYQSYCAMVAEVNRTGRYTAR